MDNSKLPFGRIKLADYTRSRYAVIMPHGYTKDEILGEGFFSLYDNTLKRLDAIDIISEDGVMILELIVSHVAKNRVVVALVADKSLKESTKAASKGSMSVEWGGPNHKHRIVSNGNVLEHGFGTKEIALERMAELTG